MHRLIRDEIAIAFGLLVTVCASATAQDVVVSRPATVHRESSRSVTSRPASILREEYRIVVSRPVTLLRDLSCPAAQPLAEEGVDIPGLAFGPNSSGVPVLWVSAYCGNPCTWPPGGITEVDPSTGEILNQHYSAGWSSTGPTGLAYDGGGFLWVADYNKRRMYKVKVSPVMGPLDLVASFSLPRRPLGGLAFDGTNLWAAFEDNRVRKLDQSGSVVATYAGNPVGGLSYANGFLYAVNLSDNTLEVRDLNYQLLEVRPSSLPSNGVAVGEFAVDPENQVGFFGARGLDELYKMFITSFYYSYCEGDGGSQSCPCGNESVPGAGEGCANSTGRGAKLVFCGSPSVVADDIVMRLMNMPPNKVGLIFTGTGDPSGPFRDGLLCVGSVVRRYPVQPTGPGGAFVQSDVLALSGYQAGQTAYFQGWFRDPGGPCGTGSNFSNAIAVTFSQ